MCRHQREEQEWNERHHRVEFFQNVFLILCAEGKDDTRGQEARGSVFNCMKKRFFFWSPSLSHRLLRTLRNAVEQELDANRSTVTARTLCRRQASKRRRRAETPEVLANGSRAATCRYLVFHGKQTNAFSTLQISPFSQHLNEAVLARMGRGWRWRPAHRPF